MQRITSLLSLVAYCLITNIEYNIKMVLVVGGTVAAGYACPTGGAEGQKSCGQQSGQRCHLV